MSPLNDPLSFRKKRRISTQSPELLLMKPRAILLNLSRGGVVNEKALFNALLQGQIFAAATDVLAKEPV
ncbi:MAG: NAD(P)-dependent oxidoreductase, partial [Spirulinaceae cyanobacterium]